MQCLHACTWAALAPVVRGWLAFGYCAFPLASLALLKACPATYRRHLFKLAWLHHAILAISHQLADITAAMQFSLPAAQRGAAAGMLAWMGHVWVLAGTNSGTTVRLCGEALRQGFCIRLVGCVTKRLACLPAHAMPSTRLSKWGRITPTLRRRLPAA